MPRRRRRNKMSEENNKEVVEDTPKEKEVAEVQQETPEETPEKTNEKDSSNDDIFITEKDRFTIKISYYIDKKNPIIEGFSDDYAPNGKEIKSFEMYFKYPSQKDAEYIMATKPINSIEDAQVIDFIELENVRLVTLMRGWSLERPMTDLAQIHPAIVKALRAKVSEEIAGNGLF